MPWTLSGAEGPKRSLEGMLASRRIPHAVLFTGPAGGGKFTFATDLAKAVNCEAPGAPGVPCGECVSCRKVAAGSHPDVRLLTPKGKAGIHAIDDVRQIRGELNLKPFEGRFKALLVRDAERFSEESGGAFLKTLEEPSPNTLIVMTAQAASGVMPTLVSRCVLFRIPPLPRADILKALSEARGMEGPAAELLAGLSGGALGRALNIDPDLAGSMRAGLENVFKRPKGPLRLAEAMRLSASMSSDYDSMKAPSAEGDASPASDWLDLADLSVRLWWRDAAVLGASGDEALLDGPPPSPALKRFAGELDPAGLPAFEEACARLKDGLGRFIRSDLLFDSFWSSVVA
jgi:DNA polymerase-3 subunit delta'